MPTGQEAPSDARVTKRHKPSPCDRSLQQDTERVKQIIMYEYGDGQNTDSPNGLPLKWTTPTNKILNEYCNVVTL